MTKFIFITGGVVSSLGKGIASASIGTLLQSRGFKIRNRKIDPYLNIDPGTMSPFQHGEVFVTNDGAETDLDLGHYERFTDVDCSKNDSISGGKIYWNVLNKERRGDYLGSTVQSIPHITNEVKDFIRSNITDEDFIIYEIGGTVGDIEGSIILEAIRQFINEVGRENAMLIHLTLLPYIKTAKELKTKPTQQSIQRLLEAGLFANIILCRTEIEITESEKRKIAMFCNVKEEDVIQAPDVDDIYKAPSVYHKEGLDERVLNYFNIKNKSIINNKWLDIENKINTKNKEITIGIVAKYFGFPDIYKSVIEALHHSAINNSVKINIKWINAEELETINNITQYFKDVNGVIVPGGFGNRGVEGKINAIKYIRENNIPFLGICLGMQTAVIEIARNLLNIKDANSTEFTGNCTPIISLMTEWNKDGKKEIRDNNTDKGGTLRLGAYKCKITKNSLAYKIYNKEDIEERHRHRYEMDINFKDQFEKVGVLISGVSPDGKLPEIIEIPQNKYFIAVQFHPEFKSRPLSPAPLFDKLVKSCL